jgi:hypothetical protein
MRNAGKHMVVRMLMPCADLGLQHAWQSYCWGGYQQSKIFIQQSEKAASPPLTPPKGP